MKNSKKRFLILVIGLVILLFLFAVRPLLQDTWVRLSGAVIPNSSRTHTHNGTPIRVLSVMGKRWKSWGVLKDATAYCAFVLLPTASACNNGHQTISNRFSHVDTWRWLVRNSEEEGKQYQEVQLEAIYDAVRRTLTIGYRTYFLTNGNLFVIRFDEGGKPIVTQLDATINENAENELVFETFKSLLRRDEIAQKLINARDYSATSECDEGHR